MVSVLAHNWRKTVWQPVVGCFIAFLGLTLLTMVCQGPWRFRTGTFGLLYVIVIAVLSNVAGFFISTAASIVAVLYLLYLAPPGSTFRVNDPLDIVAVVAFLVVSLFIARLVSEVRRLRDEARSSVNRALIDAEERDRARIANDLHDDIGQGMALLGIKIEQLRTSLPNPPATVLTMINELTEQISDLSSDIQTAAQTLHSRKLEYLGLRKTAASFCKEFGQQHQVEIDFRSNRLPEPPPLEISICLLRVLQEALSNSLTHSGTRRFEVALFEQSDRIHLIVGDAGVGFNPDAARKGAGLGLISMQERIKLVKGKILFDSQPKRGTTIHAMVDLNRGIRLARAAGQEAPSELIPV